MVEPSSAWPWRKARRRVVEVVHPNLAADRHVPGRGAPVRTLTSCGLRIKQRAVEDLRAVVIGLARRQHLLADGHSTEIHHPTPPVFRTTTCACLPLVTVESQPGERRAAPPLDGLGGGT